MQNCSFLKGMFLSALLVSAVLTLSTVAPAQTQGEPEYVPGELLVKFKSTASEETIASVRAQVGLETIRIFKRIGVHHVRILSGLTVLEVIARLQHHPAVDYAEPNYLRYPGLAPNDPRYPEMWGLNNTGQTGGTPDADIDAPEAWDIQTGFLPVVVAVLDSGMDLTHEDLAANLWTNPGEIPGNGIDDDGNGFIDDVHGWDFRDNDNDPTDTSFSCGGHGTHTAGTVGAVGNNGVGVVGVNWRVQIMPLRFLGGFFCSGSTAASISAIEYYADFGVRISNNSWGGGGFSQALKDAIQASHSLFVAAAGNSGTDNDAVPHYPSSYELDNVIAVAATDDDDGKASFSNFGLRSVDLGAPGVDILSTLPSDGYGLLSGTSMATPHVTGCTALLGAQDPTLTNMEAKWRVLKGTDPQGLPVLTRGRLNCFNALQLQSEVTIDVVPLGPTDIFPGDVVSYELSITNMSAVPQTVTALTFVRHPDGTESKLEAPTTFTLPGGGSTTQTFSVSVPATPPSDLFGPNRLVGRIFTPATFESFDEDEVLYQLVSGSPFGG